MKRREPDERELTAEHVLQVHPATTLLPLTTFFLQMLYTLHKQYIICSQQQLCKYMVFDKIGIPLFSFYNFSKSRSILIKIISLCYEFFLPASRSHPYASVTKQHKLVTTRNSCEVNRQLRDTLALCLWSCSFS